MLRGEGQVNPDGIRDYDLLIPRGEESWANTTFGEARDAAMAEAESWRARLRADGGDLPRDSRT
jgi:hypothetical protein